MEGGQAVCGSKEGQVFLLDDDASVRDGVSGLLAAQGIAVRTFASTPPLERALRDHAGPAVLLVDICLPNDDGLAFVQRMRKLGIKPPTVVMTGYADLPSAIEAIRANVVDFLEKPFSRDQLFDAIDRACAKLDDGKPAERSTQSPELSNRYDELSPREREVFAGMVHGASSKQMARTMGISPRTVEVHRSNVLHKMQAGGVVELVHMAIAIGLAEPEPSDD